MKHKHLDSNLRYRPTRVPGSGRHGRWFLSRWFLRVIVCFLAWWGVGNVAAAQIQIEITTILATQNTPPKVDADLTIFVKELKSVFRYDSYVRLGTDRMNLTLNQTGTAGLPGDRVLKVTPLKIQGDRMEMSLEIFKKNTPIFDTLVKLRNRSNIIVGGPQHQGGVLLFRLSNQF